MQRYDWCDGGMEPAPDGDYVRFADIQSLLEWLAANIKSARDAAKATSIKQLRQLYIQRAGAFEEVVKYLNEMAGE